MTIIFENFKDEHTKTEYYGWIIYNVQHVNYSPYTNTLNISTKESLITLDAKTLKRLEFHEDEK